MRSALCAGSCTLRAIFALGTPQGANVGLHAVRKWASGSPLLLSLVNPHGFTPESGYRVFRVIRRNALIHSSAWKEEFRKLARTSNEGDVKHTKRAGVLVPAPGVAF